MEERTNDIRVRCRLNILRLYPAHRQAQLTDTTDFDAWKSENVAHMQKLLADPDADIDADWPDPNAWERQTAAASMLDELEAIQHKVPSFVSDFMRENEAHGAAASRLAREISDLDNKRFLQVYTEDDERKYQKLKRALSWFEARGAVEVV